MFTYAIHIIANIATIQKAAAILKSLLYVINVNILYINTIDNIKFTKVTILNLFVKK